MQPLVNPRRACTRVTVVDSLICHIIIDRTARAHALRCPHVREVTDFFPTESAMDQTLAQLAGAKVFTKLNAALTDPSLSQVRPTDDPGRPFISSVYTPGFHQPWNIMSDILAGVQGVVMTSSPMDRRKRSMMNN